MLVDIIPADVVPFVRASNRSIPTVLVMIRDTRLPLNIRRLYVQVACSLWNPGRSDSFSWGARTRRSQGRGEIRQPLYDE